MKKDDVKVKRPAVPAVPQLPPPKTTSPPRTTSTGKRIGDDRSTLERR
jgi:hypothetical protein